MSDSSATPWTPAPRLLCPCLWDFPGKNTGVGCHFLLQGIFLTQELNPRLLFWQADSLPLSHQGSLLSHSKGLKESQICAWSASLEARS